jgi:hypothetical protein
MRTSWVLISSLALTFGNRDKAHSRWTCFARSRRVSPWHSDGQTPCHTGAQSGMDLPCSVEKACPASQSLFLLIMHDRASTDIESTMTLACRAADHARQCRTDALNSPLYVSLIGICIIFDQVVSKMCPRSRWREARHLDESIAEVILAKQIACGSTIYEFRYNAKLTQILHLSPVQITPLLYSGSLV